jgi:quercetin dioxygenase-like cupin family protein
MTTVPVINASEEIIGVAGLSIRFLLSGTDTNGSVSIFEFTVPAGQKIPAPAHKNDAYEEVLYGIEGVVTWTIDGKTYEVGPGQAVCIPRGAAHRFDNFGDKNAKQLAVITPAIMEPAYFRETRELLADAGKTKTPPDVAKMADIFRRNGMTIVPPPAQL